MPPGGGKTCHCPGPTGTQCELAHHPVEQRGDDRAIGEAAGIAAERLDDPFVTARDVAERGHPCAAPHSEQNFAARGIDLPQLMQNLVPSAAGALWSGSAVGVAGDDFCAASPPEATWFNASVIARPIAIPAPSPAPSPAHTTFVRRGDRDRLCGLVLRVVAQVAGHVHADALVELPLELLGKRETLDDERVERETEVGEHRRDLRGDRRAELDEIPRHVEEGNLRLGERVGDLPDDRVAQMSFEIGDRVRLARAADLLMEARRIGDVEAVEPEAAQPDHAEILVADRDRLLRAPPLVRLECAWRRSRRRS